MNQSKDKSLQTCKRQLKIQHTYNIAQPKKTQNADKQNIPDYVRYEKELNSDDDMFIYGNIEEETNYQFVLNDFNPTYSATLFKLMLPFLDTEDAIDFLQCCNQYGNIFISN